MVSVMEAPNKIERLSSLTGRSGDEKNAVTSGRRNEVTAMSIGIT